MEGSGILSVRASGRDRPGRPRASRGFRPRCGRPSGRPSRRPSRPLNGAAARRPAPADALRPADGADLPERDRRSPPRPRRRRAARNAVQVLPFPCSRSVAVRLVGMRAGSGPSSSASPARLLPPRSLRLPRGLSAFGFALDLNLFVDLGGFVRYRLVRHRFDVCRLRPFPVPQFRPRKIRSEREYLIGVASGCQPTAPSTAGSGSGASTGSDAGSGDRCVGQRRPARAPLPSPALPSPLLPPQPLRRGCPTRPRIQTLPAPGRALPSTARTLRHPALPRRARVYLASDSPGSTKKSSAPGRK